jgi:glycosyltransferase involved in cell wall biosynthesis/4-amino-4-deoxy-L-arabinose transferase-like glycosyltransferase
MRILLATGIYPPESGGPATYTAGLASAFRAQGHHVEVLAYGNPDVNDAGVTRVSRRGGAIIRYLRYAWHAFRLARRSDVVYAQGPVSEGLPTMIGARLAGRSVTMKVVGDYAWEMAMQDRDAVIRVGAIHELPLLDGFLAERHGGVIGLYERIERWTARRAERVIVPSRYLKTVVERWGVSGERIHVIVNATEPMPETRGRVAERRALNVDDRVVILTAVRAVPWKGVADLITSVKDLPPSYLLVVAGDGPMFDDWSLLAKKLGVEDRVRMLGRIDRATLAAWYAAADVFALNSGYEGYPHVVAEAAMFGVPCVVSDQGGNPETKETFGDLIRIVPYADVSAWTRALATVTRRSDAPYARVSDLSYADMVTTTLATIKGKNDPLSVVMVSYDRDLLNSSSATAMRVRSMSDATLTVSPMVMQGRLLRSLVHGIRLIRASSARVVVTAQDPFAAGLVGYLMSRWMNVPLEIQEHGDFFSGEWIKESWKNRVLSCLGRFILKRAERVRVVSDRVKQQMMCLGVDAHRVDVIPVAQDLSRLLEMPLRSMADVPHIVVPCRFVEQKGLDTLMDAVSQLKNERIPFMLSLIGTGPLEQKLRKRITELNLSDRVSLKPWGSLLDVWTSADLFVMSSRYEGFGRTITEAMAAGVPIVTTDVGCVGSIFRPQIDGRVVQPNDARGLAAAIREQLREPERREAMRVSARDHVRTIAGQDELHAQQRLGWRGMRVEGETGPRFELWVGAFLVLVVLSRIASVALFHESLVNREWGFFYLVDHWFQGYGYSYARELGCASAYRSPGYLFFLTGLYAIFSPTNTLAQAIVQNIFVVGVLWLVYVVGRRFVGKRSALIGGLLMTCYPYTFYHYTQYYHTFLSSFFLLLLVWCVLRLTETKRYAWAIASGVSIAALAYVQGTILPATPFIVFWIAWKLWPEWKRVIGFAAVMAIVSAGCIAPWTYRNWKELHAFAPLTTDLGHAFFKANNENIYQLTLRGYPQEIVDNVTVSSTNPMYKQYRMPPELEVALKADGVYQESVNWTEWHPREPNGDVATCAELGPLTEVEFNRYWMEKGSAWFTAHWWPEGFKLQLLKLKTFWQPSLFPSVKTGAAWSFAGSPLKVWLARNVMAAASAVVIFGGLLGIFFAVRRRDKNVWLPIVFVVVYSMLHTFFAGYTKYRIPLDNLLAMYAGWMLLALVDHVRGRAHSKHDSHDKH